MPTTTRQLSREVLRWLGSLDLAFSVKTPRRDFASGFLCAEVFSRYFDKDVSMHSFSHGSSMDVRRDNWHQLKLLFQQWGFTLPDLDAVVENVLCAHNDDVILLINHMYTFLTARKVQTRTFQRPKPAPGTEVAQSHAYNTQALEAALPVLDLRDEEKDEAPVYNDDLDAPMMSRTPSKVLRGQPRIVGAEATAPLVTVKAVDMKEVDRGIVQLRANRDLAERSSVHSGHSGSRQALSMASGELDASTHGLPLAAKPVTDCLDEAVFKHLRNMPEGHVSFLRALVAGELADSEVASVLRTVGEHAALLADGVVSSPPEFSRVAKVLTASFHACDARSMAFSEVRSAMLQIGALITKSDPYVAYEVCCDYIVPTMRTVGSSAKRDTGMRALYAFCVDEPRSHVAMIKRLREAVTDLGQFLRCLFSLIVLEPELDEALADLYAYYCAIGLGLPSPSVRAACLAMVPYLAKDAPALVEAMMPTLELLSRDPMWWEVRAQLLVAAAAILMERSFSPDAVAGAELIVSAALTVASPIDSRVVGIASLAPAVHRHPSLLPRYVNVLLSLPARQRQELLLGSEHTVKVGCRTELPYDGLQPPAVVWDSLAIATALGDSVQQQSADTIEVAHLEVLVATTSGMGISQALEEEDMAGAAADDDDGWDEVFTALCDHLLLALCDASLCSMSLQVLRAFVFSSRVGVGVLQQPTWLNALKLVYGDDGEETCQEEVATTLLDLIADRRELQVAVAALLEEFAEVSPEIAGASPFLQRLTKAATE